MRDTRSSSYELRIALWITSSHQGEFSLTSREKIIALFFYVEQARKIYAQMCDINLTCLFCESKNS